MRNTNIFLIGIIISIILIFISLDNPISKMQTFCKENNYKDHVSRDVEGRNIGGHSCFNDTGFYTRIYRNIEIKDGVVNWK